MVQTLCTQVCIWKKWTVVTIPGMGEEGMKENGGEGKFKYDVFNIL
jgi:hypothetical protein